MVEINKVCDVIFVLVLKSYVVCCQKHLNISAKYESKWVIYNDDDDDDDDGDDFIVVVVVVDNIANPDDDIYVVIAHGNRKKNG